MGNCLEICFGAKTNRRKDYFRGRYRNCDVGIEFENLMDDDSCQVDGNSVITREERELLNDHMYTELVAAQRKIDAEIDEKLQRQEEEIKLEEEAFIAAKREASRIARQKKLIDAEQKANSPTRSWLGDDEGQWEVAGGQDDFEMFLETVKARSLTVRTNGLPMSDEQNISPPGEIESMFDYSSSKKDQTVSSDDASWEGNFVNADMTPEPIVIPAPLSAANHVGITTTGTVTSKPVSAYLSAADHVGITTTATATSKPVSMQNSTRTINSSAETMHTGTDIPTTKDAIAKKTLPVAQNSVLDSSLKDFDDFLDELELELDLSS